MLGEKKIYGVAMVRGQAFSCFSRLTCLTIVDDFRMGRRKQTKPVKVASDADPETPPPNPPLNQQTPSKKVDFSIQAQLDSKPSTSKTFNPTLSPQTLSNALKAYETLLKELDSPGGIKPGPLLHLTKQIDKLSYKDPNFKKTNKIFETESALDLRIKRKTEDNGEIETKMAKTDEKSEEEDTILKLTSLVGKAGAAANDSTASVVKSSVNERREDDPRNVFTCLKCYQRFNSMEELSNHMSKTKHFGNSSIASPIQNYLNSSKTAASNVACVSSASSRSCSYWFKCAICGFCDASIDEHMKKQHSFKNPSDWMSAIKLIPI
uniref:C2H2-type domain-containing protein n=1 Tax=Panagrolaimus sp. JU765 TaxID=591449 RepID=A0AC34R3Y1_9BILA